MTLNY